MVRDLTDLGRVEVFRFVGVDADVPVFGQAIVSLAVAFEEVDDLLALTMRLETLHIAPDFVEDDGETAAFGKGTADMAGHRVLHTGILTMGVGLQ